MATKATYLADLAGQSYILGVQIPVKNDEESNSVLLWSVYDAELTEVDGSGDGVLVKHQFVVYDEGGGSEEVLNEYIPFYKENLTGYNALIAYIENITNLKSYWVRNISTEQQFAIVRAFVYVADHIEIIWYLVYFDSVFTHEVITNPEDF